MHDEGAAASREARRGAPPDARILRNWCGVTIEGMDARSFQHALDEGKYDAKLK